MLHENYGKKGYRDRETNDNTSESAELRETNRSLMHENELLKREIERLRQAAQTPTPAPSPYMQPE
jgi:regulator of replication initiation timing